MIDPLDDATQTLLRIEEVCLRDWDGNHDATVTAVLDIIQDWKRRPDEEEGEVAA